MEIRKESILDLHLLNKLIGNSRMKPIRYDLKEHLYNLEITYVFQHEKSYITLKTGANEPNGELCKVSNIAQFLRSITSMKKIIQDGELIFTHKETLAFNKDFSKVIEFLVDVYEEYCSIDISNLSFFQEEKMYLTSSKVKNFFVLMRGKSFSAKINEKELNNIYISSENLPLELNLKMKESNIILEDKNGFPLSLTEDNEYFYYNSEIYGADTLFIKQFAAFNSILNSVKEPFICFESTDSERVIFNVYPKLKAMFPSIEISEEIKNNIYEEPLIIKIYIDKENKDVTADIKFVYGDITINPFINEVKVADNRVVLRDTTKETEIIDIIKELGFKSNEDYLILEDSDNILNFLIEGLDILKEKSEVFYSDAFKRMNIINSSNYKAGIRLNDNDLLEFNFNIEGVDLEDYKNIFRALRENKKYYRLKEGSFINLRDNELIKMDNFINYLDINTSELSKNKVILSKYNAMYIDEHVSQEEMLYIEKNEAFENLVNKIKNINKADFNLPSDLENIMRNYQKTGFNWLKTLATCGLGGILADEMGLGKTLQAISFIESELEEIRRKNAPVLIICPSSLVYNWESEVVKFAPAIKTLVVVGNKKERELLAQEIEEVDMVITSYPLIRRDIEQYEKINFSYCFIDEAQNIKNPNSQTASSVKSIKANGYFAITGTPLENSLIELWSIFDFIMPGYMMSYNNFLKKYEAPIIRTNDKKALKELLKHTRPFILRRFKKEVATELPPKIEHKLVVEMTDEQKIAYRACLNVARDEIDEEIRESGYNRSKLAILTALMRLRQICCDPSIFIKDYIGGSAKMLAIDELIQESIEQGHRVLLYSQFTSVLKLIRERFEKNNIQYMYLDGQTKVKDRPKMVDDFNNGESSVFLISLKAGGTGLNLTGADVVIHFDPWWNPAVEDQATDRAHRIGQEKTVEVIKLICRGTIEEKIYNLQQKKKEIIKSVIDNNSEEQIISKMTQEEIMELFMD